MSWFAWNVVFITFMFVLTGDAKSEFPTHPCLAIFAAAFIAFIVQDVVQRYEKRTR